MEGNGRLARVLPRATAVSRLAVYPEPFARALLVCGGHEGHRDVYVGSRCRCCDISVPRRLVRFEKATEWLPCPRTGWPSRLSDPPLHCSSATRRPRLPSP